MNVDSLLSLLLLIVVSISHSALVPLFSKFSLASAIGLFIWFITNMLGIVI